MNGTKTILMIDDEPDFLSTTQFLLESAQFRVVTASSPQEGLKKALLKPDLILLDINMPGMDGLTVCKKLKEESATKNIPVIMLTLNSSTLEKVTAFNFGASDYMGKQFAIEEILARIKAVLRSRTPDVAEEPSEEKNGRIVELRDVIAKRNIRVLYQPIVSLLDAAPIGYEALVRGPRGSFLESPLDLFAFAAETDMFHELDCICREESVDHAKFMKPGDYLFLNADPSVTNDPRFLRLDFLKYSDIPPNRVCIEITERTFVKDFEMLSRNLKEIRSKGVNIAIDDVGEGYSSLSAIADLKPDFIKLDISIIRNMDKNSVKRDLVRLVAGLARNMASCLIGEGIETEAEREALLSLGVQFGQGYLFRKPFCPEEKPV